MARETSSIGAKRPMRSGASLSTTATTLSRSTFRYGSPMRSPGWVSGIGLRCGGLAVP